MQPEAMALICPLLGAILVLMLLSLIGSVILRAAVSWFNSINKGQAKIKSTGNPNKGKKNAPKTFENKSTIAVPSKSNAFSITFFTILVNGLVTVAISFLVTTGAQVASATESKSLTGFVQGIDLFTQLFAFPISFLVMSGMLSKMLPTSFPRAMAVTALFHVIIIIIFVAFFGILMAVGGTAMFLGK